MRKKVVVFVQAQLNAKGLNAGPEDGILGPETVNALNKIKDIPKKWPKTRKAVAFIQMVATEKGIETGPVDGYWGPQTEFAFEGLIQVVHEDKAPEVWRPEDLPDVNPNGWPQQSAETRFEGFYGEVGQHQVRIDLPYPHKLAWKTSKVVNSFYCHEKVHDSLHRVLSRVVDNYGLSRVIQIVKDLAGEVLPYKIIVFRSMKEAIRWLEEDTVVMKI